jgi:hypothetical protein
MLPTTIDHSPQYNHIPREIEGFYSSVDLFPKIVSIIYLLKGIAIDATKLFIVPIKIMSVFPKSKPMMHFAHLQRSKNSMELFDATVLFMASV